LNQVDTFEDGTTQGWVVGLGGIGTHPAPPQNIPTGGPGGVDGNYLLLTALGGVGVGSRMTVINASQWAGDYLATGVARMTMDVINLGTADLALRLLFEAPMLGPPTNIAATTVPVILAAGTGWTSVSFEVGPDDLTALMGTVDDALSNTTAIRLYHSPTVAFPGPEIVSLLGVDNIRAQAIPEPASIVLMGLGMASLMVVAGRRGARLLRG
jgi:hypothetical protein